MAPVSHKPAGSPDGGQFTGTRAAEADGGMSALAPDSAGRLDLRMEVETRPELMESLPSWPAELPDPQPVIELDDDPTVTVHVGSHVLSVVDRYDGSGPVYTWDGRSSYAPAEVEDLSESQVEAVEEWAKIAQRRADLAIYAASTALVNRYRAELVGIVTGRTTP